MGGGGGGGGAELRLEWDKSSHEILPHDRFKEETSTP